MIGMRTLNTNIDGQYLIITIIILYGITCGMWYLWNVSSHHAIVTILQLIGSRDGIVALMTLDIKPQTQYMTVQL